MSGYFDFEQDGDVLQQLFNKIAALDNATTEEAGLMSASDKEKLDGIESGAEENSIATIQIGGTALTPDNKVVNIETDSEPTFGSVKLVLSGPLYTKFLSYYTKAEVNQLVAAIHQFVPVVADSLPEASADTMYLLYLIPSTNPKTRNAKDEFITIRTGEEGSYTYFWEQIGTTTIDIDGKEDKANKVTSFSNPTDTQYPSAKLVSDSLNKVKADVSSLLTKAGIAEGIADTISAGTAQEFLQRQSGGDGVNCIKRIKGKTIAWNQRMNPSAIAAVTSGITNISYSNGIYTYNLNDQLQVAHGSGIGVSDFTFVSGHKYYYSSVFNITPQNLNYFYFRGTGTNVEVNVGTDKNIKGIYTCQETQTASMVFVGFVLTGSSSGEIKQSNYNLIDLTLMFGAGYEPSTAAEFEALYPGYHAYNAGVLKSNDAAALLTDGRNQWDEQWEVDAQNRIRSKNYIKVFGGSTYYLKMPNTGAAVDYYDANYNSISTIYGLLNNTFTVPNGAAYIKFVCGAGYGTTYNNDICINLSDPSFNGTYQPYWKRVLALRLSELTGIPEGGTETDRVTMFPNGAGGAGSAFDSIFAENGVTKARKTMGRVNFGDCDWTPSSSDQHIFRSDSLEHQAKAPLIDTTIPANAICAKYIVMGYGPISASDNGRFAISGTGRLVIIDFAYSDAAAFKAAMSGVYLEYELATPTVYTDLQYADGTPFTMPATILVDIGGVERVISPTHADGSPSAPFCCDSNYSISIKRLVDIINSLN